MNSRSSLDDESFQALLANAFAVQKSGLETQSLSAFVEIQRMIAASHPNVDLAMLWIADGARTIANASGVAIALLKGDQLIYRAGSGSAVRNMGRQVPAVLSVSAHNHPRREILRVENAQTDTRIEGAICRQFGAMALLIVPIFRERAVAGVLEVLFDEAHNFQDREVRAYQLMAGLVAEALCQDLRVDEQKAVEAQPAPIPHGGSQDPPESAPMFTLLSESEPRLWIGRVYELGFRSAPDMSVLRRATQTAMRVLRVPKPASFEKFPWNLAAPAVLLALVISSWIAYDRLRLSPEEPAQRVLNVPAPAAAAVSPQAANRDQPQNVVKETDANSATPPFRRVRIGENEIDYVAEDVTIRHFTNNPAPPRPRRWNRQIDIGEDVTVHYYGSAAGTSAQLQPASATLPKSK